MKEEEQEDEENERYFCSPFSHLQKSPYSQNDGVVTRANSFLRILLLQELTYCLSTSTCCSCLRRQQIQGECEYKYDCHQHVWYLPLMVSTSWFSLVQSWMYTLIKPNYKHGYTEWSSTAMLSIALRRKERDNLSKINKHTHTHTHTHTPDRWWLCVV